MESENVIQILKIVRIGFTKVSFDYIELQILANG